MEINYKINGNINKIYIKQNIIPSIYKSIKNLDSDRKMLLVYDPNIDHSLIEKIKNNLKILGTKIFLMPLKGLKKEKNEKNLFKIIDFLIKNDFTKKSILISCCGGVIGDLSGLAASLYLRGLIYFHIPSTMTSIVDSCIGGKTAINYKNITNSVGNYYHPKSIFISYEIINKMPEREYKSGIAEIIKCGLIRDNKIIKILETQEKKIKNKDFKTISSVIALTLQTKIFFVKNDIHENNKRLSLNFGHTFAHAIEMATEKIFKKEILRHGEAVGIGILAEIYYAKKGISKIYKAVEKLLKIYNLPVKIQCSKKLLLNIQNQIYTNLFLDKKRINSIPRYIKLNQLGNVAIDDLKDDTLINETIYYHIN
ncbi:3-dehydroquinate synthase family protein [Candidatus Fonsibacter ubiquis]|uniref:3-dehydroquinate synthase family protein n=1 Tax=Candidatus Fonsibacter ubiquis TaxID=1925548 RepID=UPI000C06DF4A|nr:3-dehydroquinate synthase family protein [Candidatus Fonsibacter ubiquis]